MVLLSITFIPGAEDTAANQKTWYRVFLSFWIIIGLAWFAGGISAAQNYMESSIEDIKEIVE